MPPSSSPGSEDPDTRSFEHETLTGDTTPPTSLRASISPPPSRARTSKNLQNEHGNGQEKGIEPGKAIGALLPNLAAIEAGEVKIRNHLEYFSTHLSRSVRSPTTNPPASYQFLPTSEWEDLYKRNQHPHGHHFVIHQHDHPVAGVHYDLRLQVSETSSISWAIMYGLPGNVNSRRLNRNATETRVHCVWNHLIETASEKTGSLLIWDTGEYETLAYHEPSNKSTNDELSSSSDEDMALSSKLSDSEKLHQAFQNRKIRIRLHGTRLPTSYTLSIRLLTSENRHSHPSKPSRKRHRKVYSSTTPSTQGTPPTSDIEDDDVFGGGGGGEKMDPENLAMEREIEEREDEEVRRTNAYPGATNSIGSVHQRRWYLSMDRYASGFRPRRRGEGSKGDRREWVRRWEEGKLLGFEPFFVMGREVERSVFTGRTADEVMADEGVSSFVGRKGWRPVTE